MEYLDVLDAEGNPTGQKKLRAEIHRDGDWHRAMDVWILNSKGELLLQKRSPEKENNPNLWNISVAGHIASGDDAVTTAIREAREELGVSFAHKDLEYLFRLPEQSIHRGGAYLNNEWVDVYLATRNLDLSTLCLQKEEVTAVRWIPFRELEKLVSADDKNFVPHDNEYKKLFKILHKRYQ